MRVAAIYDIHGNLPALEAVLREIEREGTADLIVVGGDVLPGPLPNECMERLLAMPVPTRFLHGNGDRAVLLELAGDDPGVPAAARPAISWVADALRPEYRDVLAAWPATLRLHPEGVGEALFCHATPHNDTEIFTRLTPEARMRRIMAGANASLVVCGHTHMPFDRTVDAVRVVNAGSVGMPFGRPGADWLMLGGGVMPRHTDYDVDAAAARIAATAYPDAAAFAERYLRRPPTEEEMLATFAESASADPE